MTRINRLRTEAAFILHLIRLNLASNMEYRASFLSQAIGMFINNGIYFVFWLLFFDRFEEIRGYQIQQIFLLFAIVALGWGLAFVFAGNASRLAAMIAEGRLTITYPARPVCAPDFNRWTRLPWATLIRVIAYLFTGRLIRSRNGCFWLLGVGRRELDSFYATRAVVFHRQRDQWSFHIATRWSRSVYPSGCSRADPAVPL